MKKLFGKKSSLVFSALAIFWLCHHFVMRPALLDWGAPEDVQSLHLAGDDFTDGEMHTRATLINATPEEIWPWLVQLGQERGGFYSHEWLENLFFAGMKNVYSIDNRFQHPRQVGDTVWLANKDQYNGSGYQIIAEITARRSCVMVGGADYVRINSGMKASGSWAIYLYPKDDNTTWLIARSSSGEISEGERLLRYLTFEVPHFIMEVRMLNTVKRLVERNHQ